MLTECKCMSFASWRAELLPLLVFDEIKNIEILIVFLILPPPPQIVPCIEFFSWLYCSARFDKKKAMY